MLKPVPGPVRMFAYMPALVEQPAAEVDGAVGSYHIVVINAGMPLAQVVVVDALDGAAVAAAVVDDDGIQAFKLARLPCPFQLCVYHKAELVVFQHRFLFLRNDADRRRRFKIDYAPAGARITATDTEVDC